MGGLGGWDSVRFMRLWWIWGGLFLSKRMVADINISKYLCGLEGVGGKEMHAQLDGHFL